MTPTVIRHNMKVSVLHLSMPFSPVVRRHTSIRVPLDRRIAFGTRTSNQQYYRSFSSATWRECRKAHSLLFFATLTSLGALGWFTFRSIRAIHADGFKAGSSTTILDSRDHPTTLMKSKPVESFSQTFPEEDKILKKYAQSHFLDPSSGIKRFDVVQLSR